MVSFFTLFECKILTKCWLSVTILCSMHIVALQYIQIYQLMYICIYIYIYMYIAMRYLQYSTNLLFHMVFHVSFQYTITNITRTLMTVHHWFRCRLGVVRQHVVTWSNVDWIIIVRAYGYNSYKIRSSYQRFITKTRYWLERVSIAFMGNGSTKYLSQLKSYPRGKSKNKANWKT